jgi:hypothetical protein
MGVTISDAWLFSDVGLLCVHVLVVCNLLLLSLLSAATHCWVLCVTVSSIECYGLRDINVFFVCIGDSVTV